MAGDEDPVHELERLERDLAAIDARWASEGYQQRTTSRVLDDERQTRRELTRRIAELRGLPPPLTPAAGTVALNVGSAWRPLAISEAPPRPERELPLPAFDVTDDEEVPPPLEELERELHEALVDSPYPAIDVLTKLTARFRKTPGALRLLTAAWRSAGRSDVAAQLGPPIKLMMQEYPPRVVQHPLLTGATELPDETTGLTPTQTILMRVLRQCAPETGPFMRASEVFAEVRVAAAEIEEPQFMREVSLLGHPSLRRLPLVTFQGFSGRFSASPSFTHVRLSTIGREVIDGTFPLPNLLANGASGDGVCLLPMAPADLTQACIELFERQTVSGGIRQAAFDLPDGTPSSAMGFFYAMYNDSRMKVRARPSFWPQKSATDRRCRVIVQALPWPHSVADFLPELEKLLRQGDLEGVVGFSDESSADVSRLVVEVEHIVFLRSIEQKLRNCGLFDALYVVEARVPAWPPSDRAYSVTSLADFIRAFLESRKEAAVKRLDADVVSHRLTAQRMEAVCVALAMIERVQSVLRETLDDAEGEAALMKCMRPEDRAVLAQLPFPATHDYANGFTQDQARYLVKRRKLAATPADAARTDWMRALDALENAKQTLSARRSVMDLVRAELKRAVERFGNEPRRSRPFN